MDRTTARRRLALFALFFLPGVSIASWVTRTPDIRDQLGASTTQMGLVLFGVSAGSMLGILSSGRLVSRFGTRPVVTVGMLTTLSSMPVLGAGVGLTQFWLVTLGLFLFGVGMGGGEVAMNVEGADVERLTGRALLPTMHGFFSLGTVVGAAIGIGLTATRFPVTWHLILIGLLSLPVALLAIPRIPPGVGVSTGGSGDSSRTPVWRDKVLWLIGVVVLAMALAEGAANDWLPLIMVDGHGLDAALGSVVYTAFSAAMAIGRFGGGWFLTRFGRPAVLGASAFIGGIGLLLVIAVDNAIVAGAAVFLWGAGAALGFPVALSAAADSGENPTARVSLVATAGYAAFLVGPPALGFLGEHYGLRNAMIVVLVLLAVAAAVTPALRHRPSEEPVLTAR